MRLKKVEKLVTNLHDKTDCYTQNKFKASTKSRISFEKVHRVISFNQDEWLKAYIEMNTELIQKAKK